MPDFLNDYEPVEDRLRKFWELYPAGRVSTELLAHHNGEYVVRASLYRGDELRDGIAAATGLAHDSYDSLPPNMKSSALEVCETSAIGRALANLGFAPKGKRPSREEMTKSAGEVAATLPAAASPAPQSGSVVGGESPTGSDPTSEAGPSDRGGSPGPASEHVHEWSPSPTLKRFDVCTREGCGATHRREMP